MPSSRWTTPAPGDGRARERRGRSLLSPASALSVVVALVAVALTLGLKAVGERSIEGERVLQAVTSQLRLQDGLEWRAISGRSTPASVRAQLADSQRDGQALITRGDGLGLSGDAAQDLRRGQRVYAAAVRRELDLLAAHRSAAATRWDERRVDPAFEAVMDQVGAQSRVLHRRASRARLLSDAGILLTVGGALGLSGVVQHRRRLEQVRRQHERAGEARYRSLVQESSEVVVVVGGDGSLLFTSPSAERLLRAAASGPAAAGTAVPATTLDAITHPDDRGTLAGVLRSARSASSARAGAEVRLGPVDGGWRSFEVSARDLHADPAIAGLVVTGHDVTDRLVLQEEMTHRALHDPLTGLPNRVLLTDRLGRALRPEAGEAGAGGDRPAGGGPALLLIDLDGFKDVNDTLGHHVGDQLLVDVGARLRAAVREGDTVARLGGDEFAVLLPGVGDLADGQRLAASLLAVIERPTTVDGVDLRVGASIGLVLAGVHGEDAQTLVQRADVAMYAAKAGGGGVAVYDRAGDENTPQRLALLADLAQAIPRGELVLHYQPQVDVATGAVCGAEALVRWLHPRLGLVPPDDFIPLAERTGLIGALTHHVLDLAVRQAKQWVDAGAPLQVSVNVSGRNLHDPTLVPHVTSLLAEHALDPALLVLEVTETALVADPAQASATLREVVALGVRVSIDDFGAGYTSFSQLTTLPVSELKIDRSFVAKVLTSAEDALVVASLLELGHSLGMSVVAEGVEDAEILGVLAERSCDVAQGYHLSRPLPAADFARWRRDHAPSRPRTAARAHPATAP